MTHGIGGDLPRNPLGSVPNGVRVKVPRRVQLPGGRVLELVVKSSPRAIAPGKGRLFDEARALFSTDVRLRDGGRDVDVGTLSLAEFHALRAIATRLGWLREEAIEIHCRNCDEPFEVRPCSGLPLGPFEDRELDDEELDRTLPFDEAHEIPEVRVGKRRATTVRFADVTVARAEPLHAALAKPELRVTSAVVRGMGILALGDEGDPKRLARALSACSDEAFGAVTELFLRAHYPLRLGGLAACPSCGARNDVDAPYEREFDVRHPEERSEARTFPSFEAFDARAHAVAEALLGAALSEEIVLVVEGGVPACDDGGEPLLGSYVPGHEGDAAQPSRLPEVTVYYRTFLSMWKEGAYDWEAELTETLEHELEHHDAFLRGHDPKDEEERDEIAREAQRLHGTKVAAKATVRAFAADFAEFLRRTWPLWVLALIGLAVVMASLK